MAVDPVSYRMVHHSNILPALTAVPGLIRIQYHAVFTGRCRYPVIGEGAVLVKVKDEQ